MATQCINVYLVPLWACSYWQCACASGCILGRIHSACRFALEINNIDMDNAVDTGTMDSGPSNGHIISLGHEWRIENDTNLFDDLAASFVLPLGVVDVVIETKGVEVGEKGGGGVVASAALVYHTDV